MIFSLIMFLFMVLAMIVQVMLPSISFAYGAHIYLLPTMFYVLALAVPYPVMLLFALLTGVAWDAGHHVYPGGADADLTFGFSVVTFALLGTFIQGIRPLFRRGRWELPVLMIGLAVLIQLVTEYLLINFRRGGFIFPAENWFKMVSTSGIAMLIAPILLVVISQIARKCGYQLEIEQFMFRKVYGH